MSNRVRNLLVSGLLLLALPAWAQWPEHKDTGIPRTADGKVDVKAPAPRQPNGKPDFSGLWYMDGINHGNDYREGAIGGLPAQPWVTKLVQRRIDRGAMDDPSSRCYPTGLIGLMIISPFRINHLADKIIVLFEQNTTFQQIFMDGRSLPKRPVPSYMGFAIGRWEGDTLVVESTGFNGKSWIDFVGHPITDQLRLTERIKRVSFGKLEVELTFDDPGAYTKPWTIRLPFNYVPDSEVTESFCEENLYEKQIAEVGLTLDPVDPQGPPANEAAEEKAPAAPAAAPQQKPKAKASDK